ncbi:hypothetical protein A6R68_01562, partial [Neotoma lepida]
GYFYEYDFSSRPVEKPRQCLPYAVVIVKFIGQKAGNGQLLTSLSTGFPKRLVIPLWYVSQQQVLQKLLVTVQLPKELEKEKMLQSSLSTSGNLSIHLFKKIVRAKH